MKILLHLLFVIGLLTFCISCAAPAKAKPDIMQYSNGEWLVNTHPAKAYVNQDGSPSLFARLISYVSTNNPSGSEEYQIYRYWDNFAQVEVLRLCLPKSEYTVMTLVDNPTSAKLYSLAGLQTE